MANANRPIKRTCICDHASYMHEFYPEPGCRDKVDGEKCKCEKFEELVLTSKSSEVVPDEETNEWRCGKCDQEELGLGGEIIPNHFRTCKKRIQT